jgi:hypothetical protein
MASGVVATCGIDIVNGWLGASAERSRARAMARAAGATWSGWFLLGTQSTHLPVGYPKPGWLFVSSWPSAEARAGFRTRGCLGAAIGRASSASLDLGPGLARSLYAGVQLDDDGWLARLPHGRSPDVSPLAVLTYARVSPRAAWRFQRLSNHVVVSARQAPGYVASAFATYASAPYLRLLTLTLWDRRTYSSRWAFTGDKHPEAMRWMLERPDRMPGGCVGRFPITAADGTLDRVHLPTRLAAS